MHIPPTKSFIYYYEGIINKMINYEDHDEIYTLTAIDEKLHDGTQRTMYGLIRPDGQIVDKHPSLEQFADFMIIRIRAGRGSYANRQGFKITLPSYNPRLQESVVRRVERGLYQQEYENLEQMLTQR